jgi:flagellar motor switch protein FliN/FliY
MGGMMGMGQPANVQSVQFPSLMPSRASPQETGNIGLIMDVSMEMTVELGRTRKLIKEILGMGEGTIIELDKLAGEPVDILVNHKLIAKGEVVVIDENFGVRVTEIVSPMERINEMG